MVSKSKSKPQHCGRAKSTHAGTFLPFISATGEIVASYFILPTKFDKDATAEVMLAVPNARRATRTAPIPFKIMYTESGYVKSETFAEIMKDFCQTWTEKHPGLDCLCIGDNLAAHKQLKVLKDCLDNNVFSGC